MCVLRGVCVFCGVCDSRVRLRRQSPWAWLLPRALHHHLTSFHVHVCVCVFTEIPAALPPCNLHPERVVVVGAPGEPVSLRPGALQVLSGRGEQTPVRLRAGEPEPRGKFGIIPSYAS